MPDSNDSSYIDRDQAVRIASRLFVAYLLFWVLDDLTLLPSQLLSAAHYLSESSGMGMSVASAMRASYLLRIYLLEVLASILRIALLLMGAGWFYRCGPRIRRFFVAGAE